METGSSGDWAKQRQRLQQTRGKPAQKLEIIRNIDPRPGAAVHAHRDIFNNAHIHSEAFARFSGEMKTFNGFTPTRRHSLDSTAAAMERMERYCAAHSGSPSAARRPQLLYRGQLWIALMGPSVEEGIVGIGPTVEAALSAFDAQYLTGLRPSTEAFRRRLYDSKVSAA